MMKDAPLWKLVALSAVILYMYKVSKANGGSLQGHPMMRQFNPDRAASLAASLLPEEWRPQAKQVSRVVIDRMMSKGLS